ncbi:MAG: hypothetical protein KAX99_02905 [Azonexus sp.]|nr:hypothetical protein [Azonexus sp.]
MKTKIPEKKFQKTPDLFCALASVVLRAVKSSKRQSPALVCCEGGHMQTMKSDHATVRAQQRGVPPLIQDWLLDYGAEQFDGHGGVVRYFSNECIRQMERDIGKVPLTRMSEYLRCYLVQCSSNGSVITVGKRHGTQHIRRH